MTERQNPTMSQISQEEMEALLASPSTDGKAGGARPVPAASYPSAVSEPDDTGVRRYDLTSQQRYVRGRMPALEALGERFARNLRDGLAEFVQRQLTVQAGPVRVLPFEACLNEAGAPASYNVMNARPLRGSALVVCAQSLVSVLIDALFGGSVRPRVPTAQAAPAVPAREFSATEQRIIARLMGVVSQEYAKAWKPVYPLELDHARSELFAQFAPVAAPGETVVCASFRVTFEPDPVGLPEGQEEVQEDYGDGQLDGQDEGGENPAGDTADDAPGGDIHICLPWAMLEPIRERLYAAPPGDKGHADLRWMSMLTQELKAATVELSAELAHGDATVRELMALKVGDFIALDRLPTLLAKVDGVPVFECDYGTLGARYGVRIREFLTQPAEAIAGKTTG